MSAYLHGTGKSDGNGDGQYKMFELFPGEELEDGREAFSE